MKWTSWILFALAIFLLVSLVCELSGAAYLRTEHPQLESVLLETEE